MQAYFQDVVVSHPRKGHSNLKNVLQGESVVKVNACKKWAALKAPEAGS